MKLPPAALRAMTMVLLAGTCLAPNSIIPAVHAYGYRNCGCNQFGPYLGSYRYGFPNYSYGATRYSALRYRFYQQPFGIAHPRSLIGRYGYGAGFGYRFGGYANPFGGYTSSVISSNRYGGYFPYRTSARAIQYGRSFFGGQTFPRYRIYFGQSLVPGLQPSALGGLQFVSTNGALDSIPADEGWILLSEGQAAQAVVAFDKRVSEHPGNMSAKVGLALSFALAGDLKVGAWHMRQACSSDAGVLNRVLLNDELRHQVGHLISKYKSSLSKYSSDRQSHFMLAALNYLAGDKSAAARSIAKAIHNGDRTAVARHLQKVIEDFDTSRQTPLVQN